MYGTNMKSIINACRLAISDVDKKIADMRADRTRTDEYKENWIAAFNNSKEEIVRKYSEELKNEYEKYLVRLQDRISSMSVENTALNDLALLDNKYITFSQDELDALIDRHKDSYIMMKALKAYATEHTLSFSMPFLSVEDKKEFAESVYYECNSLLTAGELSYAVSESSGYFEEVDAKLPE